MDIAEGFHLIRDGDAWAAVGPEFVDLQRSPAGFGQTQEQAVRKLQAELRKAGYPDHEDRRLQGARAVMRTLTLPREVMLPGWRVAVLAYRAARQAGRGHHAADAEALAAFRKVLPDMTERQAVQEGDQRRRLRRYVSHQLVLARSHQMSRA